MMNMATGRSLEGIIKLNKTTDRNKKNNVSAVIILLILAFICAGIVYLRYTGNKTGTRFTVPTEEESASYSEIMTIPDEPEQEPVTDTDTDKLVINEIMIKNRTCVPADDGAYYDWVELLNISDSAVELTDWGLTDGGTGSVWKISGGTVAAGETAVIFLAGRDACTETMANFSLSYGETITLVSPLGFIEDSVECADTDSDVSYARNADGVFEECIWPTPGHTNTTENYDIFEESRTSTGPIIINEVVAGNIDTAKCNTGYEDWIEIKNISALPVNLSQYYLSDDRDNLTYWQFPDTTLAPGGMIIIYCSGDETNTDGNYVHSGFSINAVKDEVYLSDDGGIIDCVSIHDIPVGGSIGKIDGRGGNFYFTTPTPGQSNSSGYRRVAAKPQALTSDGVYDDVESVMVQLSGEGTIYYTVDGTDPTYQSAVYTGPFYVSKTTIVRAMSAVSGLADSRELVLSYIINENHTLPVLSLVADDYSYFSGIYWNGYKYITVPGSASLYDGDSTFTRACGIKIKGWTSRELPKKSLGVSFSGKYGDGALNYDVFDSGISYYEDLSIRAGQDYTFAVIRNELMQSLVKESSDSLITQNTKYCVLYINGNYWGIYAIKEDINRSFYATINDVDKEDVEQNKSPTSSANGTMFYDIMQETINKDMSTDENYEWFCSVFDVDNLIDWIIFEGFSGNSDINGNIRYFRIKDGKWQMVYYDLDWAFNYVPNGFDNVMTGQREAQIYYCVISKLLKNTEFCERLARRGTELMTTTLTNEHLLERIDEMLDYLSPELERDRTKWSISMELFEYRVQELKDFITTNNWSYYCYNRFMSLITMSNELRSELWAQYNQ